MTLTASSLSPHCMLTEAGVCGSLRAHPLKGREGKGREKEGREVQDQVDNLTVGAALFGFGAKP